MFPRLSPSDKSYRFCRLIILAVGTLLLYAPTLFFQFLYYDDNAYVYENLFVRSGLSLKFFKWVLTANVWGNWHPLTMVSHALDWQLFGAWAGGHHLTSVLFHTANTLLLFLLFQRMTNSSGKSFVLAALFAWHPVKLESVVWIAERKDVLSTFFVLLSMLAYVRQTNPKKKESETAQMSVAALGFWPLLFFLLSLLCKAMYITLPAILLIFDFWPLRRTDSFPNRVLEKMPYLLLSAIFCVIAFYYQAGSGAIQHFTTDFPLPVRLANIAQSFTDYITLFFWPAKVSIFYPYIPNAHIWFSLGLGFFLMLLTLGLFLKRNTFPYFWAGWCLFMIGMLPVIGIVKLGSHWIACRYLYFPSVGLCVLLIWGADYFFSLFRLNNNWIKVCAALVLLGSWATTAHFLPYWRNSYTLFHQAVDTIPNNWVAHVNLRAAYGRDGDHETAAEHLIEAIRIFPGITNRIPLNWLDFYYMGVVQWKHGRTLQSISFLREANRILARQNQPDTMEVNKTKREALAACLSHADAGHPELCKF